MPVPLIIAGGVLVLIVALIMSIRAIFNFYVKVSPNKAAVFYGSKSKGPDGKLVGSRIVTSGGAFRKPFVESVAWLDLNVRSIDLDVENIPNIDAVPVSIKGVANVKIKSDIESLNAAAERFLETPEQQINQIIYENLLGHLRAIAGTMTVEQLIKDREKFNKAILEEAGEDLAKMGLQIDLLKIQDIRDYKGYIEALGKPKAAVVQRDAQIATAQMKSEGDQKAAVANQQARSVEADNEAKIAEAQKDRDVKKAQYAALTQEQMAIAQQAGPKATAKATQEVVKEQQALAEQEALRRESQLKAEIIKPAEAEKEKVRINAEAAQKQMVINAEASKEKTRLDSEAAQIRQTNESLGKKAQLINEADGEASKIEAIGKANAAAILAVKTAEAKGVQMMLEAEAQGILKKAEAMQKLDDSGRMILVLEKIPPVIEKYAQVVAEGAKPMANIDKVTILDMGGEGQGPSKFAQNTITTLTGISEALKATTGVDIMNILSQAATNVVGKVVGPSKSE